MKPNHKKTIEDFLDYIEALQIEGFNPIAVTQMYFENTFVFETSEEAKKAYHTFEVSEDGKEIRRIVGWFYGKDHFIQAVDQYNKDSEGYSEVLVYWLEDIVKVENLEVGQTYYNPGSQQNFVFKKHLQTAEGTLIAVDIEDNIHITQNFIKIKL